MDAPPPQGAPPGWYPDPSGMPGALRWWDGRQWSTRVTSDPTAAGGPPSAEPSAGQQRPPGATGPGDSTPVPPPPGAPGPGYVAPPDHFGSDPFGSAGEPAAEVLTSDTDGSGSRRPPAWLVLVGVVVLATLAGGAYLVFFDEEREPRAASSPSASPTAPNAQPTQPSPPDQPRGPRTREPPNPRPEPAVRPRLTYEPIGGDWQPSPRAAPWLLDGDAETQITEPDYTDGSNWQALLAVGYAQLEWIAPGDLAATAEATAAWFAENGFGAAEVSAETTDGEPTRIGGYEAYVLKQHFSYSLPELDADGETVYVVTVDLGEDVGVFVASIPNTHERLVDDADRALESLTVVE